jgi:hypothetical protein
MQLKDSIASLGLLNSMEKFYLPFEYIKASQLIFKPENEEFSWSGKPKAYDILTLAKHPGKVNSFITNFTEIDCMSKNTKLKCELLLCYGNN